MHLTSFEHRVLLELETMVQSNSRLLIYIMILSNRYTI